MPVTNASLSAAIAEVQTAVHATARADLDGLVGALSGDEQNALDGLIGMAGTAADRKRAVMLAHRFFGTRDNSTLPAIATTVNGFGAAELAKELAALHQSWVDGQDKLREVNSGKYFGSVFLAPSFRYANSEERRVGPDVMKRSQQMCLKAVISIKAVPKGGEPKDAYEAWFGTYDGTNPTSVTHYEKVRKNVLAIYEALCKKPVRLYYRGPKLASTAIEDKPGTAANATISSAVASAFTAAQVASMPRYANSPFAHISFGTQAFSHGAAVAPSSGFAAARAVFGTSVNPTSRVGLPVRGTSGQNSLGGTILHELSHFICSTEDEDHPNGGKSYGVTKCTTLKSLNQAKACNNADNYKYYFESFQ